MADVGAFARLAADPWLRRAEAARRHRARGARRGRRGGRSRRRAARACAACGGTRCCAWARASSGGGRPRRSRASCRASPTPAWTSRSTSATRELRREIGEPRADDGAPGPVRGDGDGEAGGRGAELLVRRRRLLLLLDRRGRRPARRRCTTTTPSCRGGCRRRWSSRPATGWCSGSICACGPRGATARCATRSPRPSATTRRSGGPGSGRRGCARGPPPAIARWATSCSSILEPFIYPRSVDARLIDDVRGLRALFRDPADAGGALGETGFDVKLGAGGIRDVEMVVQALQLLHAGKRPDLRERNTPRAFPRLVVAGLLGDREAWTLLSAYRFWRRLEHRVQVATGAQTPPAAGRRRRRGRASPRGWASTTWRRSTRRCGASARRSRRSPATLGEPPAEMHLDAARLLDPLRDRAELERLAGGRRVPRRRGGGRHAGGARGALAGARCWRQAIASPDPDRALLHFRDLIWRSSDASDAAAARRAAAGAHARVAVRHQRSAGGSAGPRTRRCGTRWSRGWARACGRSTSCGRGSPPRCRRAADADDEIARRCSCARSAAFRPRRRCASACTTWRAICEPAEVTGGLTDLAEVCLAAGDRGGAARRSRSALRRAARRA